MESDQLKMNLMSKIIIFRKFLFLNIFANNFFWNVEIKLKINFYYLLFFNVIWVKIFICL